jgi:hypothetical protein
LKKLFPLFLFVLFIGCGYKPVAYYAKKEIQGLVYIELKINIDGSRSSVFLKDMMNRLIIGYLDGKLTDDKELADTLVYLSLPSISHGQLTSQDGYTTKYRTSVNIGVQYLKKGTILKRFTVHGYSDYEVASDAHLSDQRKNRAIADATDRALKKVFTKIAVNNLKVEQ